MFKYGHVYRIQVSERYANAMLAPHCPICKASDSKVGKEQTDCI